MLRFRLSTVEYTCSVYWSAHCGGSIVSITGNSLGIDLYQAMRTSRVVTGPASGSPSLVHMSLARAVEVTDAIVSVTSARDALQKSIISNAGNWITSGQIDHYRSVQDMR